MPTKDCCMMKDGVMMQMDKDITIEMVQNVSLTETVL